jgi:hypothetical protein
VRNPAVVPVICSGHFGKSPARAPGSSVRKNLFTVLLRLFADWIAGEISYDYLWTDELVHELDNKISAFAMATRMDQDTMEAIDPPVPPFANSHLVGNEFAGEAAVHYFRMRMVAEVDYRCVRAYLERTRFGPMPFLVQSVIRRLAIKIDWDMCKYYSGEIFEHEALKDSMESLRVLQDHKDMTIEIYLHPDLQFCRSLYHLLETIKPGYLQLREANVDIRVLGYKWFSGMEAHTDTTSEQLNYYFTRTPKEWLELKADEIKTIPDEKLRRLSKRVSTSIASKVSLTLVSDTEDYSSSFRKGQRRGGSRGILDRFILPLPTVAFSSAPWLLEERI